MTISEIIDGLEEIQNQKLEHTNEADIQRVCQLTVRLALHIQQLEVDMRRVISWGQDTGNLL